MKNLGLVGMGVGFAEKRAGELGLGGGFLHVQMGKGHSKWEGHSLCNLAGETYPAGPVWELPLHLGS
jgi:hypothetical protein